MRRLLPILCLTFAVLLFAATEGHALPLCPEDQSKRYHNCYGTYTSDGNKYVSNWRDDRKHGHFTVTYANGDKCIGEYRDGKENGQGTYTWADCSKYAGEFKDGLSHGYGTKYAADGTVEKQGYWGR